MYWQFLLPFDRAAYRRDMDHQSEVRDFLTTRRARLNPDQVGLPHFAGRRRVPGLRREEVAMLTGVSTEYYARLERGHLAGVSDQERVHRIADFGDEGKVRADILVGLHDDRNR